MNFVPIYMLPTQYPLLPSPWAEEIRWSLLPYTFLTSLYLRKYIQFKFTSRTLQCTLNGIYTFSSNWNHGGLSCDVHFEGYLRSNWTNIWSDKSNIRNVQGGGARTGIEDCWTRGTWACSSSVSIAEIWCGSRLGLAVHIIKPCQVL